MNALGGPAERHGSITQCVLTLRTLGIFQHLAKRRLANVEKGVAAQVLGADFGVGLGHHLGITCTQSRDVRNLFCYARGASGGKEESSRGGSVETALAAAKD